MKNDKIAHKEILNAKKKQKVDAKSINSSKRKIVTANNKTRKAEEKLIKANHLYSFISHINRTISKVKNERDLFNEACKIAVEKGNFKMAWMGTADIETAKVNLVSSAGLAKSKIELLGNKSYDEDGPTELVLMGNTHHVINDLSKDTEISWAKFAQSKGLNSSITLAIKKNKKTVACFYIYSTDLNFFDKDEITMLLEVAHDISFCLDNIEKAKQQKISEDLILQSEKRFRLLTENSIDMVTLSNKNGDILYGSPSITKFFGYTTTDILQTQLSKVIHPDDMKEFILKRKKFLTTDGASFSNEHRLLHKNGKWIWCEAILTNHLLEPGIHAIVTNFRDISARKEEELRISFDRHNLSALINNTDDLLWSVDTQFNLITSNLPFQKSLKKAFELEIKMGENVLPSRFPKDILNLYKNWYQRAFNGEFFTEIFYTPVPSDYWMEISFHPIKEGKTIIGTACHSRDITLLKKSEISLLKSKEFTADVLNSLSASIAVIDAKGNLIKVNDAWNKFSERNEESNLHHTGIGSNYLKVCRKSAKSGDILAQKVLEELNSIYKNEKTDFYLEYPCHTTFSQNWYGMYATKLKSDVSNLVISHVDISERKKAEVERGKITQDLLQRNRDLEQFTFIVSHNLRAPLANILGISSMLINDELDTNESKEFINGLSISAHALDNVLQDLNTILQVKRDVNDKKEPIYFSNLVKEISHSIANLIEKNQVKIVPDFSSAKMIFSIRAYMYSIFYNLIINSIKYRQPNENPVIEISSEIKMGKTILTFKDNGLGIDLKSNSNRVFGLYNRFHWHVEGKGMGLFMTKSQVVALGGTINIKSEPLNGTLITIEI